MTCGIGLAIVTPEVRYDKRASGWKKRVGAPGLGVGGDFLLSPRYVSQADESRRGGQLWLLFSNPILRKDSYLTIRGNMRESRYPALINPRFTSRACSQAA